MDYDKLAKKSMKTIVILLFGIVNVFACELGSLSDVPKSKSGVVVTSPTPDGCVEKNYRHKSEEELSAMTHAQLVDEEVKEQLNHMPSFDDYGFSVIRKHIRNRGPKTFPVLTDHMNAYDPKNASECERMRFFVASTVADDLDKFVVRLRATEEGQTAIDALERAIDRMREAGFDKSDNEYKANSRFNFASLLLKQQKGINSADRSISDTFWVRRKIQMSDQELLEFSNFLIARDPTYPSWSDSKFIKDHSRFNEAGYPLQVFVLEKPERYFEAYEAYLESKKVKP